MTQSPAVRRTFLAIAALLLLFLAWTGVSGGIGQMSESRTPGQIVQTVSQLAYGVLALLSLITALWAPRWSGLALACWVVCLALAAGLATVVWGGESPLIGFVSAIGAALVALGIGWLLRAGVRSPV